MKKTWLALSLAVLLALSLIGCAGSRTGDYMDPASPSPSMTPATQTPGPLPDLSIGDDDLAGSDGVVGGDGVNDGALGGVGAGDAGNDSAAGSTNHGDAGRADDSALENMERGVRDTLDDLGAAARRMGEDARRAIEG